MQIAAVADAQHGVISLAQLENLGLGQRGVQHRLANGRLMRVFPGVYALHAPSDRGHWLAALVASGERAVLSHRSAAELWDLLPSGSGPIHVTRPGANWRGPAGVAAHRSALDADEVTVHDGIRCTTIARTLVDVASQLDTRRLTRAIERAEEDRRFDLRAVSRQLERMRGRRGASSLRVALEALDVRGGPANDAERRLLALIAAAGLPEPEVNAWLPLRDGGGYRPDFLWRDRRLIAELDGRAYHARLRAFEHDRVRDRRLLEAGFVTVRFAAREVSRSPSRVTAELRRLLDRLLVDSLGTNGI